ncbi:MAG: mechanosensitive ion channel [Bacteroidales bacterium]|nr:mechanosensitive ion channel [Bacteroidales bacterium]MDE6514793.1 mechanosensitive ion channel [Bacteroidales bacterium]MDE7091234.1 mechanosensitive ion channel [Bacteroidales bacterium]
MEDLQDLWSNLLLNAVEIGKNIVMAIVVYFLGRLIVKWLNKLVAKVMERRGVEATVRMFLGSIVNILLMTMLIIAVISILGIETTSIAALVASAGLAVGMALSGNLQNFAGGVLILLFKPFKVGDTIEAAGITGEVKEIRIFHTLIWSNDEKHVIVPNGMLSNGVIKNLSRKM